MFEEASTGSEMAATEAALLLRISRERVIRLVQVGRLKGRRDPDQGWRIERKAVEIVRGLRETALTAP